MNSQRYIALFDILGFRTIVQNNMLDRVVQIFMGFLADARFSQFVVSASLHEVISYKIFSDTIFAYSRNDSIDSLVRLIKFSQALVGNSFGHGLLLRGAITKGEVFIQDDIFIGKPIVRAYQMEQEQDWVGCWIDDECIGSEKNTFYDYRYGFLLYDIPLKSVVIHPRWALNWVIDFRSIKKTDAYIKERFAELFSQNEITLDVHRKIVNTKMFIEYIHSKYPKGRYDF